MSNPFSVPNLDALSTADLFEKLAEYEHIIESLSRYPNSTMRLLIQNARVAQDEILAEIERRKGKPSQ